MFNFNIDKKYIYIILAGLVIFSLISMTQESLLATLLTLPGVIIAITFHEFAHAFVADRLGDTTPRSQGRLNLNPLSHLDPIGSLMLIFAHVGWGKPVEINPRNFNRNMSLAKAEALVSVAGPVMNFILAIIITIIYCVIVKFAPMFIITTQIGAILATVIQYTIIVNVGLGVFNLLPFPPLDGSKIFKNILPYNARRWLEEKETIFYIIFLILWITGLAGIIISPIINLIYTGLFSLIGLIFGI